MKKALNYIWRAWFLILAFIITLLVGLPVYFLSFNDKNYPKIYFFVRVWCFVMFYGMGLRYDLVALSDEKLPKNQPFIFISNHTSIMDIMLPCLLFPQHPLCFVGKKELEKIPIFGTIYKRICVMVDRSSPKSRAEVYSRCAAKMQQGNSIVIFPEGGVPDDTTVVLDDFKDGAFVLAEKHQFPITMFTLVGLKEMFPFSYGKGYPGRVKVYFNGVLSPNESANTLKNKAYTEIKNTLTKYN